MKHCTLLYGALLCLFATTAAAQIPHVANLESTATIDGPKLIIDESWTYDFEGSEPLMVERPLTRTRTADGERVRLSFDVMQVATTDGTPIPFELETRRLDVRVRMYPPEGSRWSGRQAFHLRYAVGNVIDDRAEAQDVVFHVTGGDWRVPIAQAAGRIVLPDEASARAQCLVSRPGDTSLPCEVGTADGTAWTRADGAIPSGSALTLTVRLPQGTVSRGLLRWAALKASVQQLDPWFLLPLALAIALLWFLRRGAPKDLVPDPNAQVHLGPAETGLAFRARLEPVDFAATVLDLARRGHIVFERVPSDTFRSLRGDDWLIQHTPNSDTLRAYEVVALDALLGGNPTHRLSELGETLPKRMPEFRREVFNELRKHGRTFHTDPERLAGRLRLAALAFGGTAALALGLGYGNFGLALLLSAVLLVIAIRVIPTRTAEGTRARTEIVGLRRYFLSVTADELAAQEEDDPDTFAAQLPYAMVLRVADAWAEQFPAVWVLHPPGWIAGDDPIGALGDVLRTIKATAAGHYAADAPPTYTGRDQSW